MIPLADFVADPVRHLLDTPSDKIVLASRCIAAFGYEDCPGLMLDLSPRSDFGARRQGNILGTFSLRTLRIGYTTS
ncbi:hypothetical protein [Bosea lathyri]|uniref:hypothetical protein n=1 Tax=Bosea lathyri TaxID=1036778 RepID=UPI000CDEE005|nr:hypothetical protein [Bosea lathyri]